MPLPDTPPGMEARYDAWLTTLLAALGPIQSAYLAAQGRYWQGITTHIVIPEDGAMLAPDKTRKPTDQAQDWGDAGVPVPALMQWALRVDVYQTPRDGWGYAVVGEIVLAGRRYRRTVNVGPEPYRAHAWQVVEQSTSP